MKSTRSWRGARRARSSKKQDAHRSLNFDLLILKGARTNLSDVMRRVCPPTGRNHLSDVLDGVVEILTRRIAERRAELSAPARTKAVAA